MAFRLVRHKLRQFWQDDEGNLTIELVMWLPVLLIGFQFVADLSISMMATQDFHVIARDASRMVATGQRNVAEAEEFMRTALADYDNALVEVVIANNFVTSTIEVPAESVTKISGRMTGQDLGAEVSMWVEKTGGAS